MRQLSLDALFGTGEREVVRSSDGRLEVFDLFCGGGGFLVVLPLRDVEWYGLVTWMKML